MTTKDPINDELIRHEQNPRAGLGDKNALEEWTKKGSPMKEYAKVGICIPNRDTWKCQFGRSFGNMMAHVTYIPCGYKSISIAQKNYQSSILASSRQLMVRELLEDSPDITHFLFLDDDMEIPPETVSLMLLRDVDIVASNVARKCIPTIPNSTRGGELVYTTEESTGLEEVDMVGTAVMMIKADVFKKLRLPWFATPYYDVMTARVWEKHKDDLPEALVDALENVYFTGGGEERNGFVGEDIFFCNKAKAAGYKIYIDHDLSKGVSHVGDLPYKHEQMEQWNGKEQKKARVKAGKSSRVPPKAREKGNGQVVAH